MITDGINIVDGYIINFDNRIRCNFVRLGITEEKF